MKNLAEEITYMMKSNQKTIDEAKTKLAENFCYHFPWIGEDLYKAQYKQEYYDAILKDVAEVGEEQALEYWTKSFTSYLSRSYNVRENSTGALFREASTWKFQAQIELLESITK